jgi:hypothetical protein
MQNRLKSNDIYRVQNIFFSACGYLISKNSRSNLTQNPSVKVKKVRDIS